MADGFNFGPAKTQIPNASQSADGLMSSTDKTKLDGVATGATAVTIVDNLTTDDATKALSAKQGKALNDQIGNLGTWVTIGSMQLTADSSFHNFSINETIEANTLYFVTVLIEERASNCNFICKGADFDSFTEAHPAVMLYDVGEDIAKSMFLKKVDSTHLAALCGTSVWTTHAKKVYVQRLAKH